MKKKLLNNLGLKLTSLVLAFVLWFIVVQTQDPQDKDRFTNVPVKLINTELLEEQGKVYEVLDNTDKINVTVSAPMSIIKELRASDIVAEADVSRLTDINTIPITLSVQNAEVNSIVGSHEVVRLNVENKTSKWIKLLNNTIGEAAEGYIISNAYLDQTNIEVSGPESLVSRVKYAAVDINVEGATNSLSANVDIKLFDEEDKIVESENIKKNVDYAHMTVEVLATKEVPVSIDYMGEPEEGYLATGVIESNITTVKIAGTASALANVGSIAVPAERVDITDVTENLVETISIREYLPSNIKFADRKFDGKITATVYIEQAIKLDVDVPSYNITFRNIPEGYVAKLPEDIEYYSVALSGLENHIEAVVPNQVGGIIDVAEWMQEYNWDKLPLGKHEMPVVFGLAEGLTLETPLTVQVIVSEEEQD